MKLSAAKKFCRNYTLLSFLAPAAVMLTVMFITSVTPFGDYTLLYSDNYHQYYPFFKAFREALLSGDSLLWNWSVGLGMDYLGLISYYLASPLNLLSVLVPEGWTLTYFTLLVPIKLGLAGGFFGLFLKKVFDKDDPSLVLFGCFYAMCAWALGYHWNIMWMDTFALLPLVMLGMVQLLKDKKFVLYTIALFLAVVSNYYVGFFVCIFVFLSFFCYEICRFRGVLRFLADLGRIAVFSILAIGMTAFLELPTLAALQDTYSSVNSFPEGFAVNIVSGDAVTAAKEAWAAFKTAKEAGEATFALWWDAMKAAFGPVMEGMEEVAGQMGGGITLTYIDGLPNLYCGAFAIGLGFLFLLSKDVRVRDKICSVILLLFFMLSFILRQLDYIWHGFHFTNQIPYRFSFLFSFVLLYMAYQAWVVRDNFKVWQIVAAGVLSVGLLLVDDENRTNAAYLLFNLVFLALYLVLMLYGNPNLKLTARRKAGPQPEDGSELPESEAAIAENDESEAVEEVAEEAEYDLLPPAPSRRRYAAIGLACIMVLELVVHVVNFTANFAIYDYDYPKKDASVSSMIKVMKELEEGDELFYRAEMTHAQTLNDGALNAYNGISTFTSSANVKTTEFMDALGYAGRYNWNRYCWEEASPVSNLFLNLKYMIERDNTPAENSYFDSIHTYQGITLLENNAYLPLGFLAESSLATLSFADSSAFNMQNKLFRAATGIDEPVWSFIPTSQVEVSVTEGSDITLNSKNISGYTSFSSGAGGKLLYTYSIEREGFMCLDLTLYAQKNFVVRVNGTQLYSESYSLATTMAVCDVHPGDTVELEITVKADTTSAVQVRAAVLNEDIFREGYDILSASTLALTDFSNTYIAGVIECDRDGLLYTSIPQCGNERTEEYYEDDGTLVEATTSPEGNWVAYVDGKKAEIVLVGDCMVALNLTEGTHYIEFRYENPAFKLGAVITVGCALVFGGITLACYLVKRKKNEK